MRTRAWSAPTLLATTPWRACLHTSVWTWGAALAVLSIAALAGAGLGVAMTSSDAIDASRDVLGDPWIADGATARGGLFGVLGLQITLIGLVLSASTAALYGLVADQSRRLVAYLTPSGPLLRAAAGFAVTTGYVAAAVRRLGPTDVEAPRPAVTVGVAMAIIAVAVVMLDAALSLRKQNIEEILRVVTSATQRAIASARERTRGWRVAPAGARLVLGECVPLRAHRSGYVLDVDLKRVLHDSARFDARARVERVAGEYVVEGETIGSVSAPEPVRARAADRIAHALLLGESRSPEHDVGGGLRVLVDIAERALSPAVNDPYTACEALYRMRGLLRELASMPDGDWLLVDEAGTARASIARPSFQDLLRLAVDGPSRYGAADPDVLEAILGIAWAIGCEPSRREDARHLAARVLDDAASSGMSRERVARLEASASRVLRHMESAQPVTAAEV